MRKLKLQVQISIDGFIAGSNGEMDWMNWNWGEDIKNFVAKLTEPVDTILLGKNMAGGFIPHWAAQSGGEDQKFVDKMNLSRRIVFSRTMKSTEWDNVELVNDNYVTYIQELKKQNGGDVIVYGGASFVSSLIKEKLIDELNLFVNPTAIGKGMPIFQEKTPLQLVQSIAFECGINVLQYKLAQ